MSMSAQKDRHTFRVGSAEWCGAGGAPGLGHCRILVKHDVSTCQCSSNLEIRQDHASVLWPPCPRMQDIPRRNHHRQINPQTNKAHDTSSLNAGECCMEDVERPAGFFLPINRSDFAHHIPDVIMEKPCPFPNVNLG